MKKKVLWAVVTLLLLNLNVHADEIRLSSSKTDVINLGIVCSSATTVSVDWGDGKPVLTDITQTNINGDLTTLSGTPTGEIIVKGDGITVFDGSLCSVKTINVTQAPNMIKLSVNNNLLSTVDLSKNVVLYSLHIEANPSLASIDLSNNTALELLYCNDNNMTSLDVSHNAKLTTLNFNNNKLTTIDLSKNTALKSLYATTNQIESIDLTNNVLATYISLNTNKLSTIDVTPLTALKSLFLLNNNLTELKGANPVAKNGTLNCSGNKLNLLTLPQPEALKSTFNYAPQQAMVVKESVTVGEALDLSAQTNVKGILTSAAATTFQWSTKSGTVLQKGKDYEENNGVFKFLVPQSEKVVCSMTTTAFPKFTTTVPFTTTEIAVVVAEPTTCISAAQVTTLTLWPNPVVDKLIISSDATINKVEIYNALGSLVYASAANTDKLEMNVDNSQAGVYFAKVTTAKGASILRYIVKK